MMINAIRFNGLSFAKCFRRKQVQREQENQRTRAEREIGPRGINVPASHVIEVHLRKACVSFIKDVYVQLEEVVIIFKRMIIIMGSISY